MESAARGKSLDAAVPLGKVTRSMRSWPPASESDAKTGQPRLRALALGYAGGLLVAAAASWLRYCWAGTLRIDTATAAFAVSSLLLGAGLGLSSACGWKLLQSAPRLSRATILRLAIAAQLVAALAVPLTSGDYFQFLAYGQLQLEGKNPLAAGPSALGAGPLLAVVSERWASQPSVYGPLLLLLLRGAAWAAAPLASPLWGNGAVLKLAMLASVLATLFAAAGFLRANRPGPSGDRALALLALSPLMAWELSGQGHSDGVLTLSLMLFAWAAVEERELPAVLALAAGTWAKVTIAPILALYLLFLLRRRGLRAVVYGMASLALGAVLFLPYVRGFPGLGPMLSAVRGTRSHSLGDLLAIAATPLGPAAQHLVESASFLLCIAACAAAFAYAALRARTVPQLLRGALFFLFVWDLTVPLFQPWYATWLLPLAIADTDERWQDLVALYCIFCVLQWAVQIDPVSSVALDAWVVWRAAKLLRGGPALPMQELA